MFWCKEYNLNIIFPAKITSIWIRYNFAPLFWIQTWVTFDNRYNFIVLFSILFNNFLSNDVVSELPILLMVKLHLLWPFFFSLCCSYDHIAAASESIGRLCNKKNVMDETTYSFELQDFSTNLSPKSFLWGFKTDLLFSLLTTKEL